MNQTTRPDTPDAIARKRRTPKPPRLARVLIIDDNPLILKATRRILGKDHDVVCAMGASIALSLLKSGGPEFDAIVCGLAISDATGGKKLRATIVEASPELADRTIFASQPLDFGELRRSIRACRRERQGDPAL